MKNEMLGATHYDKPFLERLARLWYDNWPYYVSWFGDPLTVIGTVWLAVAGFYSYKLWPPVLVTLSGLIVSGYGKFKLRAVEKSLVTLKEELHSCERRIAEQEETLRQSHKRSFLLMDDLLGVFANLALQLTSNERITLYVHKGDSFEILGRYSKNPMYAKYSRRQYAQTDGVIGKAWQSGNARGGPLPDPTINIEEYVSTQKNDWNIPKEVSRKFAMKSRVYRGTGVMDRQQMKTIAVIILESTDESGLNFDGQRENIMSIFPSQIAAILEKKILPESPESLRKDGF